MVTQIYAIGGAYVVCGEFAKAGGMVGQAIALPHDSLIAFQPAFLANHLPGGRILPKVLAKRQTLHPACRYPSSDANLPFSLPAFHAGMEHTLRGLH